MCRGFPLTSQHCEAEAALVTARGLFIGVEGIPEHFATSLFPRFLGLGSPWRCFRVLWGPLQESETPLCLLMTAVFIHIRDVGARALAFLIFEVLIFEGPVSIRRAGG